MKWALLRLHQNGADPLGSTFRYSDNNITVSYVCWTFMTVSHEERRPPSGPRRSGVHLVGEVATTEYGSINSVVPLATSHYRTWPYRIPEQIQHIGAENN